jgi:glycoprotein endo-alpha-1,2-mannosidase
MKTKLAILLLISFTNYVCAKSIHSKSSAFTSYKGLVMADYQGWFNAHEDGAKRGRSHSKKGRIFDPSNIHVDLSPDVTDYKMGYNPPFKLASGLPAYLFSSYDVSTIDLRFKWMRQYGIDGVFIQRFVSNIKNQFNLNHNDRILLNSVESARKYHRAIAVMYDLSGMRGSDAQTVISDWKHLVDSLHLTTRGNNQNYLYHNGRPLVSIWGVGFPGRIYSLQCVEKIIDFLKNDPAYGGCAIMLGVPDYWHNLRKDAVCDPYLLDVIRKIDIIHPWSSGSFTESSYLIFQSRIKEDINWCKKNKIDYVPTIFPGFS